MWFWLKTHGAYNSFYHNELRKVLKPFFHTNQQLKYFKILAENGFVGRDSAGKIYLRGFNSMFGVRSGVTLGRRCLYKVSPEWTETKEAWLAFLAGVQVISVQKSIRRATCKVAIAQASTPFESGGTSEAPGGSEFAVSLENLSRSIGVSSTTASRLRSRAATAGLITNRQAFQDVTGLLPEVKSKVDLSAIRHMGSEYADPTWWQSVIARDATIVGEKAKAICWNAVQWHHGRLLMQRPNMVANMGLQSTFKSR